VCTQHFHVVWVAVDALWPSDFRMFPGDGVIEDGGFGAFMVVQPIQDALALFFTVDFRRDKKGGVPVGSVSFPLRRVRALLHHLRSSTLYPSTSTSVRSRLATCFMPDAGYLRLPVLVASHKRMGHPWDIISI